MTRNFDLEWMNTLSTILEQGNEVSPRGMKTLEVPQYTIEVNMRHPVLTCPQRKLNYQFMAAEAFWILSGDDTVVGIGPWNSNIAKFSDDGDSFYGAYGPRIVDQLPYVVHKLVSDRDTRQAVMTTWIQKPRPSKDIPCTVAFDFKIREDRLNLHVFMRSSDVWLGLPYDTFNFSMLATLVCARVNLFGGLSWKPVSPGHLFLTAASSHLYETHFEPARTCLAAHDWHGTPPVPEDFYLSGDGGSFLMGHLRELRETKKGNRLRWWEPLT